MQFLKAIIFILVLFFLASCTPKQVFNPSEKITLIIQKDKKEIEANYDILRYGFEKNNFEPYYSLLADDVIIIDEKGQEVYGKNAVIKHFDHQMEALDFQLLELKTDPLKISGNLAVGKSVYKARIYNDKGVDVTVNYNYHLIWEKDAASNWRIIREVYNPVN